MECFLPAGKRIRWAVALEHHDELSEWRDVLEDALVLAAQHVDEAAGVGHEAAGEGAPFLLDLLVVKSGPAKSKFVIFFCTSSNKILDFFSQSRSVFEKLFEIISVTIEDKQPHAEMSVS